MKMIETSAIYYAFLCRLFNLNMCAFIGAAIPAQDPQPAHRGERPVPARTRRVPRELQAVGLIAWYHLLCKAILISIFCAVALD